jgi:hypothetical protein
MMPTFIGPLRLKYENLTRLLAVVGTDSWKGALAGD